MRNDKSNHRRPGIVLLPFVLILSSTVTSFAHPMGNFSVNHYAKIKVDQGSIEIKYLIDMAEIPTFQEIRQFDITPTADSPRASRYLDMQGQFLKEGISLVSDSQSIRLDTISRQVAFARAPAVCPR